MDRLAVTVWRSKKLIWKSWDGESIVFNPASGNTHLLNPTAAEVLKALGEAAASPSQLSHRLACRLNFEPDSELCRYVEAQIANLDEMGLIEPVF